MNKKIIIVVVSILIVLILSVAVYFIFFNKPADEPIVNNGGIVDNIGEFVNIPVINEEVLYANELIEQFHFTTERHYGEETIVNNEFTTKELLSFSAGELYKSEELVTCSNTDTMITLSRLNAILDNSGYVQKLTDSDIAELKTSNDGTIELGKYNIYYLDKNNSTEDAYAFNGYCDVTRDLENDYVESMTVKASKSDNKLVLYQKKVFNVFEEKKYFSDGIGYEYLYSVYGDYMYKNEIAMNVVDPLQIIKNYDYGDYLYYKYTFVLVEDKYILETIEKNVSDDDSTYGVDITSNVVNDAVLQVSMFHFTDERQYDDTKLFTNQLTVPELIGFALKSIHQEGKIGSRGSIDEDGNYVDVSEFLYTYTSIDEMNEYLMNSDYITQKLSEDDLTEYFNELEEEDIYFTGYGVFDIDNSNEYIALYVPRNSDKYRIAVGTYNSNDYLDEFVRNEIVKVDIVEDRLFIYQNSAFALFDAEDYNSDDIWYNYYEDYRHKILVHSDKRNGFDDFNISEFNTYKYTFIKVLGEYFLISIDKNVNLNE